MEFFLPILKSFLQVTYLFSPHWLTLLYESWVGFVASFSSMKFLVVYLVLWLPMCVVGRLHLLLSAVILPSAEKLQHSAMPVWLFLNVFMHLWNCALLYGSSPLFFLLLFVSSLLLLSSFGYMVGKLSTVATVMVDTVPSVNCRRHCALHHVPTVRWEPC